MNKNQNEVLAAAKRIMEDGVYGIIVIEAERAAEKLREADVDSESDESRRHCLQMGLRAALRDLRFAQGEFSPRAVVAGERQIKEVAIESLDGNAQSATDLLNQIENEIEKELDPVHTAPKKSVHGKRSD